MKRILFTVIVAVALSAWCAAQTAAKDPVKIIHGPVVELVGDTTAQIAWSTNVNAGTILHYGTDPNNLDQKRGMPWGGLTHRVELKDLKPTTTYYFKAESDQGQGTGTDAQAMESSFQTRVAGEKASAPAVPSPAGSEANPLLAGPIPQLIKDTSAQIWWLPSQPATAVTLTYGTSSANMDQRLIATPETGGGAGVIAQLTSLQPDTTYYYAVFGQNNQQLSGGQFKTEPANYAASNNLRITKGPVLEMIGSNSAVIAWSTNVRAGSIVHYGTDAKALNQSAEAPWGQETHRVALTNLQPHTRYYFEVQSTQEQGTNNQVQTQPSPFQTVALDQQAVRNIQPR
jgi:phosphodiesterase/alkaline phosphatase D-like protein